MKKNENREILFPEKVIEENDDGSVSQESSNRNRNEVEELKDGIEEI